MGVKVRQISRRESPSGTNIHFTPPSELDLKIANLHTNLSTLWVFCQESASNHLRGLSLKATLAYLNHKKAEGIIPRLYLISLAIDSDGFTTRDSRIGHTIPNKERRTLGVFVATQGGRKDYILARSGLILSFSKIFEILNW